MLDEILQEIECTGCSACSQKCPQSCIEMLPDSEGFLVPVVDLSECIQCGVCVETCPEKVYVEKRASKRAYLAVGKDNKLTYFSASGGAFITIAKYVVDMLGGIVFGCAFDNNMHARHIGVQSLEGLKQLQGSKYVQSEIGDSYTLCEKYLREGKYVLFSGTPCQIAGLLSYLGKEHERLITMDIVCHGVPSPALFKRYIKELSSGRKGQVRSYRFRTRQIKRKSAHISTISYKIGKQKIPNQYDAYYRLFLSGSVFRNSCFQCRYAELKRVADFTIGDCDSATEYSKIYETESASTLLLNTDKAFKLWNKGVESLFITHKLDLTREANRNHQLQEPFHRPDHRSGIYSKLENMSWNEIQKEYAKPLTMINRCKIVLLPFIPRFCLKMLLKLKLRLKHVEEIKWRT